MFFFFFFLTKLSLKKISFSLSRDIKLSFLSFQILKCFLCYNKYHSSIKLFYFFFVSIFFFFTKNISIFFAFSMSVALCNQNVFLINEFLNHSALRACTYEGGQNTKFYRLHMRDFNFFFFDVQHHLFEISGLFKATFAVSQVLSREIRDVITSYQN